ncbi:DUF6959 family protein [Streptomyces amritsarensis]|uniref:DUF6959 family protein n=1 Tax=Streptomyces amritsarensis TaxID=681158 RepID=UPI0036CC1BF1
MFPILTHFRRADDNEGSAATPPVLIEENPVRIRSDVAEIVAACAQGDIDDAHQAATLLLAGIDEFLDRYESALKAHGIERPYAPRT